MPVYLAENAFIALTLSAIETSTKYEACGILLGYKAGGDYRVENAIPYQLAKRTQDSTSVSEIKHRRIRRVSKYYIINNIIGEFHTHPDGSPSLSRADKDYARSRGYELEIVISVSRENSQRQWDNANNILVGSIAEYDLEIGGWVVKPKRAIKKIMICPYAIGLNAYNDLPGK